MGRSSFRNCLKEKPKARSPVVASQPLRHQHFESAVRHRAARYAGLSASVTSFDEVQLTWTQPQLNDCATAERNK